MDIQHELLELAKSENANLTRDNADHLANNAQLHEDAGKADCS